ncbi:MAG: T9SS type A sorting domain-containing protein, partial [Bacteroidales bacterium]
IEFLDLEGFDAAEHNILITGSMIDWVEPGTDDVTYMDPTDDPDIYRAVFNVPAGTYEYKYFSDLIDDGWDGGEWAGGDNREVEVTGDMEVENIFAYSDDEVPTIDIDQVTLSLYPNPTSSQLTIEANTEIKEVRMVDMLGQVVYSQTVQGRTHEINVNAYNNGVYFVQVLTSEGLITERVQVTR